MNSEINPRRRSRVARNLIHAKTIEDLRLMARRRLPNFVYEYIEGGGDGETTLLRNRRALGERLWAPRMALDLDTIDATTELFGAPLSMPVVIAPTGFNGMSWHDGDLMLARAASEHGIAMAQSTVSMNPIETVATAGPMRHWFQLYGFGGSAVSDKLIAIAEKVGCESLMITIDTATAGNRVWDQRNYASLRKLSLRSKVNVMGHPRWLWQVMLRNGMPNFKVLAPYVDVEDPSIFQVSKWVAGNRPILDWAAIERIRGLWPRKLIIKGILRADEAQRAVALGADAIVVSNHGGRQADHTVSSIEALPHIRAALGPDFPILIDSGFRSGSEIALALAQGASAVMVGRATLYGLAAGGQPGVARALSILNAELRRTMGLVGARTIDALTADMLFQHPAPCWHQ